MGKPDEDLPTNESPHRKRWRSRIVFGRNPQSPDPERSGRGQKIRSNPRAKKLDFRGLNSSISLILMGAESLGPRGIPQRSKLGDSQLAGSRREGRPYVYIYIYVYRIGSDRSAIRPRRDASAVTSVRHPKVAAFIPPFPVCTATQARQRARSPIQMSE